MDSDLSGLADNDEDILGFDVPDDTLERAAGVSEGGAITLIYGTVIVGNCGCPCISH